MSASESQNDATADPLVSWESIPGAGGSRAEQDGADTEHAGSAYEQVRGLLAEPGPRVGTSRLSEKMAEEMESFDQRWSERPVSSLVAAGKKMVDTGHTAGLDRLLGLASPPASVPDGVDEMAVATPDDEDTAAEPSTTSALDVEVPDQSTPPPVEQVASQERSTVATANHRLAAAQEAYRSLNPVEVEIFLDEAELLHRQQAAAAASRSQRLALDSLNEQEGRILALQRDLETERARADVATQEAAAVNEALAAQVAMLEGRLELAATEIESLRRIEGDDSEGGAGRQLIKGSDDLRPADADEPHSSAETRENADADADADETVDDAYTALPIEVASEQPDDVLAADVSVDIPDESSSVMREALQRLANGEHEHSTQEAFGE
ncbi:hypothetical protein [Rhodococcoides fascians]|uniref:hypothetical protein n=1 Tax=Rhodococcoides fascians TaxID=1828 RepID=UPI00050C238D|nr:hypothetical protein [Rhodococcus fascians]